MIQMTTALLLLYYKGDGFPEMMLETIKEKEEALWIVHGVQSNLKSKCQNMFWGRAHNSSPHKWYCHFWDWHIWYLTLLIKLKLILVNIGTLNYWYWAQFTLTLLKLDISDLQNDWHLQVLMFGIIDITCFWFLSNQASILWMWCEF